MPLSIEEREQFLAEPHVARLAATMRGRDLGCPAAEPLVRRPDHSAMAGRGVRATCDGGYMNAWAPVAAESAVRWLLQSDEPGIRYLTHRDVLEDSVVHE